MRWVRVVSLLVAVFAVGFEAAWHSWGWMAFCVVLAVATLVVMSGEWASAGER